MASVALVDLKFIDQYAKDTIYVFVRIVQILVPEDKIYCPTPVLVIFLFATI